MAAWEREARKASLLQVIPEDTMDKRTFTVRTHCEYSFTVDAVDEADALA